MEKSEIVEINMAEDIRLAVIDPLQDISFLQLNDQIQGLCKYAATRIIISDEDVKSATNDLSIMQGVKKALEALRAEKLTPLRVHTENINNLFKTLSEPLSEADQTTRGKVLAYRQEQDRKAKEAEDLAKMKADLAAREQELTGNTSEELLTPTEIPAGAPAHVRAEAGTLGTKTLKKFEVVDFAQLPDEFKVVDMVALGKQVRAGRTGIAGVKIWEEPVLNIRGGA